MPVKITYFVHGTTTDNKQGLATGWADGELSELGKQQAIVLGKLVNNQKYDAVICSDLKRAVDSAELSFKNKYQIIKDKRLREVNENTILISHSCGSSFLVRWLGETKRKINKLILVAPWKIPDQGDKIKEKFYLYSVDQSIKDRVDRIIMFTSDNERSEGKKSLTIFHDALGGKIINLPNHGHYIMRQMGTEEFPELIDCVIK